VLGEEKQIGNRKSKIGNCEDALNRLSGSSATGSSTYSFSYVYNNDGSDGRYGNMTCSGSSGCASLTYEGTTNRIKYIYIGTASVTYDARGRRLKPPRGVAG